MKKSLILFSIFSLSLLAGVFLRIHNEERTAGSVILQERTPEGKAQSTLGTADIKKTVEAEGLLPITLMFVGDIMLDRLVESSIYKNGGGDFKFPFLKIAGRLKEADILFGNLEGPVSDKGADTGKPYSFRMSPKAMDGLLYAGFDALSLANNHAEDWGREALSDSLARLNSANITPVGAGNYNEAYIPKIIIRKGVKIGYLAYTDFPTYQASTTLVGIARADEKNVLSGIKKALELSADFIVVSYHFGEEYKKEPSERQKYLAHLAIDSGVSLVVGHHPHVTQTYEEYKDGYIAYSLGNFIFDQDFSTSTMEGAILKIDLGENSGEIQIKSIEIINSRLNQRFQPEVML